MKRTANDPIQNVETIHGIVVYIEWPKGSTRIFQGSGRKKFMHAAYGYIPSTTGGDGEEVDVYVGEDLDSDMVFRVKQIKPDGQFDEYKYMMGFKSQEEAQECFLKHIPQDRFGEIDEMTIDQFKELIEGNKNGQRAAMKKMADDRVYVPDSWYTRGEPQGPSTEAKYEVGQMVHLDNYLIQGVAQNEELDGKIIATEPSQEGWNYQAEIYSRNEETGSLEPTNETVWATEDDIRGPITARRKTMNGTRTAKDWNPEGDNQNWAATDKNGQPLSEGDQVKNADPGPNDDPEMIYTIMGYSYPQIKVKDKNGEVGFAMPSSSIKVGSQRQRTTRQVKASENWDELSQYLTSQSNEICKMNGCTGDEHNCESYAYIDANGRLLDVCGPEYFSGSAQPFAAIAMPWTESGEALKDEVAEQVANYSGGPEPDPVEGPSGMFAGASQRQAGHGLSNGDTVKVTGDFPEGTIGHSLVGKTGIVTDTEGKTYPDNPFQDFDPSAHVMVEIDGTELQFPAEKLEKVASKKKPVRVAENATAEKIMEIDGELYERAGQPQSGQFILQDPWATEFVRRVRDTIGPVDDDVIMELEDQNFHSVIELLVKNNLTTGDYYTKETYASVERQAVCPAGLPENVKEKVKKEYGPDDPKSYETMWSIKDKMDKKKGSRMRTTAASTIENCTFSVKVEPDPENEGMSFVDMTCTGPNGEVGEANGWYNNEDAKFIQSIVSTNNGKFNGGESGDCADLCQDSFQHMEAMARTGSCPPGLSKDVKDKVKEEYGPDNPKTYQTLNKIKDEQKKGSVKQAAEDLQVGDEVEITYEPEKGQTGKIDRIEGDKYYLEQNPGDTPGGAWYYATDLKKIGSEIKIGHEVFVKDLGINAYVKMIEGELMTISSQQFGDHFYVVGDDNIVRRRRRYATEQEEINDLERMKLRLEQQKKETEDETQMQALEHRLEELTMQIDKANSKQAMENPHFWDKVGQEDIDEGNEKKLRSPASEEISERGHEEQEAHPSKGEPGEGTEYRHEISAEESAAPVMGGMPENVEQKVDAGEAGVTKFALDEDMFKDDHQKKMESNEDAVVDPRKGTDFDEGGYQSTEPFVGPSAMPGQEM